MLRSKVDIMPPGFFQKKKKMPLVIERKTKNFSLIQHEEMETLKLIVEKQKGGAIPLKQTAF